MAGKGSKQRPTNIRKFNSNFDDINWNTKKGKNVKIKKRDIALPD